MGALTGLWQSRGLNIGFLRVFEGCGRVERVKCWVFEDQCRVEGFNARFLGFWRVFEGCGMTEELTVGFLRDA